MATEWTFPSRIVFGAGAVARLPEALRELGAERPLVVTDEGLVRAGQVERVLRLLRDAGLAPRLEAGVPPRPTEEDVRRVAAVCAEQGADALVGLGGGASLDVARLARLLVAGARSFEPFVVGGRASVPELGAPLRSVPLVAVPTTAGTGSEVAPMAFVRLGRGLRAAMVRDEALRPQLALLDPELTVTLPPELTAATGFAALTHCIEAYCAPGEHPVADAVALQGVRLVARWLERAVQDGEDLAARGAMLQAAALGGMALAKGTGPAHVMARPLAGEYGLHHGLGTALCLPAVLDFQRHAAQERLAAVARALGVRGDDEETLAFECSGAVRALRDRVGLPGGLARLGVESERIARLAKLAHGDPAGWGGARACERQDVEALYRASL